MPFFVWYPVIANSFWWLICYRTNSYSSNTVSVIEGGKALTLAMNYPFLFFCCSFSLSYTAVRKSPLFSAGGEIFGDLCHPMRSRIEPSYKHVKNCGTGFFKSSTTHVAALGNRNSATPYFYIFSRRTHVRGAPKVVISPATSPKTFYCMIFGFVKNGFFEKRCVWRQPEGFQTRHALILRRIQCAFDWCVPDLYWTNN